MPISDADFYNWLELPNRREWLLEIDYVWPTWRVGTEHATDPSAINTIAAITALARTAVNDTGTVATNYFLPTTLQTLAQQHVLRMGECWLYVTTDRGLRIKATDTLSSSVETTAAGPIFALDTLHALRMELDPDAAELRAYVDGALSATLDVSTLGEISATPYRVYTGLFSHVEGVQGYARLLESSELQQLNTPRPPADINGWAEVIVPYSTGYSSNSGDWEVEAQYVDLLNNSPSSYIVSANNGFCDYVASPASTAGVQTERYSLGGHVTGSGDSPAHTPYDARLVDVPTVTQINNELVFGITTERISGVALHNSDGSLNFWRWVTTIDQSCTLRLGDPGWALSDFRPVIGKVLGVGYERDQITFDLGGLTSLLEHRANPDDTTPICIGGVEGAQPGPDFTWKGATENPGVTLATLGVVRDRGASVGFTVSGNTFSLTAAPVGEITYDTGGSIGTDTGGADQTIGMDGVLKQFILHHTELTAAEVNIPTSATILYPDYYVYEYTPRPALSGGVYVDPGSEKTAFEVCADLARSALRVLSGQSGQLALHQPKFGLALSDLHGQSAEQLRSVAIRRARDGELILDYAYNPLPLSDVAGDTGGTSVWRRRHLYRSIYGADTELTGEYPFAPYRDIFSAPWLRNFSSHSANVTDHEIRYQRELAKAFAEESGLWRVDFDHMPWRVEVGRSYRIFAPEFATEGAICHVTGRSMGGENYLLVLTNGH